MTDSCSSIHERDESFMGNAKTDETTTIAYAKKGQKSMRAMLHFPSGVRKPNGKFENTQCCSRLRQSLPECTRYIYMRQFAYAKCKKETKVNACRNLSLFTFQANIILLGVRKPNGAFKRDTMF